MNRRCAIGVVAAALVTLPGPAAWAWSDPGHEIVAAIAYARLTHAARAKADALLAADTDKLTAADFVSRATWADRWRDADRDSTRVQYEATRQWHYVNIQIDGGSLDVACRGHPPLPAGTPASQGPAAACVVDKVGQFAAELRAHATSKAEKIRALKFLLHFVGDLHQPLHAADHHDSGGNDVPVLHGHETVSDNLHHYWDSHLVQRLGSDPKAVAATINASITSAQARAWRKGKPADWAIESSTAARSVAYDFSGEGTKADAKGVSVTVLDAVYDQRALPVVRAQLARAGVRLGTLLNAALR